MFYCTGTIYCSLWLEIERMEMCVSLHWDYILQSMARNRKDGNVCFTALGLYTAVYG